ncbi:type IV pilus biogenesis protein PilM [Cronobacter sakazakii]|nr:type IV pilus biogenesis protein PilM [Cronobacter sakazakii]
MLTLNHILLVIALIFGTTLALAVQQSQIIKTRNVETDVLARTLFAYLDAASEYRNENPSVTGNLNNAIKLPAWVSNKKAVTVLADTTHIYVYTPSRPGLMTYLRKGSYGSFGLGQSTLTVIVLRDGSSSPKPSSIPSDQVVFVL